MHLPDNSQQFRALVLGKLRTYCDTKIWSFSYESFTCWLNNFDCKIEEYLALQLLDSLIVRSNEMAIASYERVFCQSVRQHLIKHNLIDVGTVSQWKEKLKNGSFNNELRFSPVRLNEDVGESGGTLYRMLSGILNTKRYTLTTKSTPKIIILIDDIIGSGEQFCQFAAEFNLKKS